MLGALKCLKSTKTFFFMLISNNTMSSIKQKAFEEKSFFKGVKGQGERVKSLKKLINICICEGYLI